MKGDEEGYDAELFSLGPGIVIDNQYLLKVVMEPFRYALWIFL